MPPTDQPDTQVEVKTTPTPRHHALEAGQDMPDELISQAIALLMRRYHLDADAAQALVMQLSTHNSSR